MPKVGDRLTPGEISGLRLKVPNGTAVVWGQDHSGVLVPRGLRPGYRTALVGEFGKGFDVDGPTAALCGECGEIFVVSHGGELTIIQQRHLSREHGINAPMLPPSKPSLSEQCGHMIGGQRCRRTVTGARPGTARCWQHRR